MRWCCRGRTFGALIVVRGKIRVLYREAFSAVFVRHDLIAHSFCLHEVVDLCSFVRNIDHCR